MIDGNKTELTTRITAMVCGWMLERGFKPVETEVPVARGWVADVAGTFEPCRSEAVDLRLIPARRGKWGTPAYNGEERERLFRELPDPITGLIEVKTSRADFRGDRKWTAQIPTSLAWVATPPGLIKPEEVPAGWGWIIVGDAVQTRVYAPLHQQTDRALLTVVQAVAVRRHNVTHNARMAEFQKRMTAQRAEERASNRLRAIIDTAFEILSGSSDDIEELLRYRCSKMPIWAVADIKRRLAAMRAGSAGAA